MLIGDQLLYVAELFFIWGIMLVKVAILAWYRQVFTTRKFRLATDVLLWLNVMWGVAMTIASIIQCIPLQMSWNPLRLKEGNCIAFGLYTLFEELFDVVLNIAILLLPLLMIRKLQIPVREQWVLSFIFLLGSL